MGKAASSYIPFYLGGFMMYKALFGFGETLSLKAPRSYTESCVIVYSNVNKKNYTGHLNSVSLSFFMKIYASFCVLIILFRWLTKRSHHVLSIVWHFILTAG